MSLKTKSAKLHYIQLSHRIAGFAAEDRKQGYGVKERQCDMLTRL